jgi:hypothetical protein
MSSYVSVVVAISPHPERGMGTCVAPAFFQRLIARRDKHGALFAAIENGHSFMAIERAQNLRHASTEIKNSRLHIAPSAHSECVLVINQGKRDE